MYILTGAALVHRISVKLWRQKWRLNKCRVNWHLIIKLKKISSVKQPLLKLLFSPISFQLTAVPLQCWAQCEDQEGKKKKVSMMLLVRQMFHEQSHESCNSSVAVLQNQYSALIKGTTYTRQRSYSCSVLIPFTLSTALCTHLYSCTLNNSVNIIT